MVEQMTTDVRAILDRDPFDASAVADLREVLGRDPSRYKTLRDAAAAMMEREKGALKPMTHLRLGVADVLLGRYQAGLDHLAKAGEVGLAHFFRGLALENLQRWEEAAQAFAAAARAGYDPKRSELHRVGALRRAGREEEARALLSQLESLAGTSAEYHYQRGSMLAAEGDLVAASVEFEKALSLEKDHTGALFELAYINDLYGNDDAAIEYYKRCTQRPPVPLAALINLGILYEDEMRFRDAEACYRQVLQFDPNHPRARLFFKDCRASRDMYYDEEAEKGYDRLRQLLEIPVTDFELSVRSRNCLRKMNIRTLGDLTRTTEQALLASKNFGETSLQEIKEMMTSKGLRLGMALEAGERLAAAGAAPHPEPVEELSQEERALLAKPISDLNLSVRARKCMTKLGISTIGDLISRTGDELLECKNFGVTSLNEVREKLAQFGLKLKNE
ncbi:MAG: RNA polymerase subunit sigma [Isosphaeraceae bacterium]|nr:RNA polymerase subunit sigma [Isosphaeraceae bacterium]